MILIALLAATLRLTGVRWDGGVGAHPDERYVVGIAERMAWPDRLNPFMSAADFAYGHLPLYLIALLGGQDRLLAARLLAALFDTGTVALVAGLGWQLKGRWIGLVSALFLAVMPLHVQQAHFATVDPFLAFFATGSLLFAARWAAGARFGDAVLAGVWMGLAVGCKAGAVLLACPLAMACWVRERRSAAAAAMIGAAAVAFAVTNPFALVDLPRFWVNLSAQAAMVRGGVLVPYTLQYHGTLPYIYPFVQQALWGMGPVLAAVCFGGLAFALWRAFRRPPGSAGWVALAWGVPFFAFTGALFVKFPRYLLLLTPLLAVYGAWGVCRLRMRHRVMGGALAVLSVLPAAVISLALVLSYGRPHPWEAASGWLRAALPPGAVIAVEDWDHPLPLDATGYDVRVLPIFDVETDEKLAEIDGVLAAADALVIASRRGYGALAGWPERFPFTTERYRSLFAGASDFEVVACFERWPRVGSFPLADDPFGAVGLPRPACPWSAFLWLPRLDESFVVYDHPHVMILQRAVGAEME